MENMAYDRFVNWTDKRPTRKEVQHVLEDYFAEAATKIAWSKDRFFIDLVGTHTNPLRRMKDAHESARLDPEPGHEGRLIEVWLSKTSLDVMTRHGDEFTNRVADGLAKLFARFWQAELEME